MATQAAAKREEPGTALELVRPEQRGLMQTAAEIGALVNRGGLAVIDLTSPEILKNYNVLVPTKVAVQANPNWTPSVAIVHVSRERGSLYSLDKKWNPRTKTEEWQTVSFGKIELLAIAKAMGLRVLRPDVQLGQGASRRDILIIAHVQERDVDGTWIDHYGTQMWQHDDEYERTVAECPDMKWEGKGDDRKQVPMTQQDKDGWIAKNWLQRKKFSLRMTDTKALEAAIRFAAVVPTKFPIEDLDKPWLAVRYTFTPDPTNVEIVLAQIESGDRAVRALYPAEDIDERQVRQLLGDEEQAETATDPESGVRYNPKTGVVEGECTEEEEAEGAPPEETHGEKPEKDPVIPRGPHAKKKLSEICLKDPEYARDTLLPTESLGPDTEAWLAYYYGAERYEDVQF